MRASSRSIRYLLAGAAILAVVGSNASSATARDFFSSFFDTLAGRPEALSKSALGYNGTSDTQQFPPAEAPQSPATTYAGRSSAYCVRTCDGRYFPISASNEQSRAATCSNLCPASETRVFYGSSIDHATSDGGKAYSSLPNAFKYREQLVQGCTCNGKDSVGLASISVGDDKTIRKGDIVAGENGLIVANRAADRKGVKTANFSPAPQQIRDKFERPRAVAQR